MPWFFSCFCFIRQGGWRPLVLGWLWVDKFCVSCWMQIIFYLRERSF
jgi:hypothetical protein